MLLRNQFVQLIRDHKVSDICAANLTATISDENVFRTNGKDGTIVDPIKFEYMSPQSEDRAVRGDQSPKKGFVQGKPYISVS